MTIDADARHRYRLLIPPVVTSFREARGLPYAQLNFGLPFGVGLLEFNIKAEGNKHRVGQCLIKRFRAIQEGFEALVNPALVVEGKDEPNGKIDHPGCGGVGSGVVGSGSSRISLHVVIIDRSSVMADGADINRGNRTILAAKMLASRIGESA